MTKTFTLLLCFLSILVSYAQTLNITELGRYTNGTDGACEISDYDSASQKIFITNASTNAIDIVDASNLASPTKIDSINIATYGGGINSLVNLNNGYIATAIEAPVKQDSGKIVIFSTAGDFVKEITVGALPDMITFSKKNNKLLVACEGEPSNDYTNDPEGSICIIDLSNGVNNLNQNDVVFLNFTNAPATITGGLKKPGNTWSKDLEPEYIAINEAETEAMVICQENNVAIKVNLTNNSIVSYTGLGFKDHNLAKNAFDASDKDDSILIKNWNVMGVYQPDAIASYTINGNVYWLSANEGDARDYAGYSSETRVKNLTLDPTAYPNASTLQANENLGRLKTFTADMIGDTDGDGDIDQIYSYGARSFSIWNNDFSLKWDSGNDFEKYIEANHSDYFNCNSGKASKKDERSDDKGAEPEAITVGKVYGKHYAFIGLERQGGVMVYNIENPATPTFETFLHTFDTSGIMTDIAPEGIKFVAKTNNPTENHLLIVSNEVSGTTTVYSIEDTTSTEEPTNNNGTFIIGNNSSLNLNIYPNPAQDKLYINANAKQELSYTIYNLLGKNIKEGNTDTKTHINTSKLKSGFYFIVFNASNNLSKQQVLSFTKK